MFNPGDEKVSQSDSEPVQTDELTDGRGEEISSFEQNLF
jgi:hypothetical protein